MRGSFRKYSYTASSWCGRGSTCAIESELLLEQDDEWAVAERRYFSAESMKLTTTPTLSTTTQEILAAIA